MTTIFYYFYLAAVVLITLAWLFSIAAVRTGKQTHTRLTLFSTAAAVTTETVYIGWRWKATGHAPIFGTFETTLAAAWCIGILAIALYLWKNEDLSGLNAFILPWALLAFAWGARFRKSLFPLTISEQSWWVEIHIIFAWLAYLAFILSISCALAYLLRAGLAKCGRNLETLPDLARIEEINFKAVAYAFVTFSLMMAVGSWYLFVLLGEWYKWEIVGTLSFLTWLAYGLIIHMRLFFGWSGKKFAIITLLPILLVILTYWVWGVWPGTYHNFDFFIIKPY